jgi:anion-transporting  ArsA/GET3 family ATPase
MLEKRFVIVGGKGGVGRTVVSVVLATLLARRGRRVLLAHVRSKQRLSRLLGCEDRLEIDEQIREVEPNLWAVNMTPEAALREKGLMVLRFKAVYRAVLDNRIVKYFLRAVPALAEYSMLGKVWYHTTELVGGKPRFDTVIFDGPAMGHLVTMLRIPQVIVETVPEGPLSSDAREVLGLLRDPARTCLAIVTLAEEMPAKEAVELMVAARNDLGIAPVRLIVNALYPASAPGRAAELLAGLAASPLDGELAALCASAQTMRARREINERHLRQLARQVPLPLTELPHLFVPELTRREVDELAAILEPSLA